MKHQDKESIDIMMERFSNLIAPENNREANLKSEALLKRIAQHRKNMKYLINMAIGEKKIKRNLKPPHHFQQYTLESDLILIQTLRNLRQQILDLEKQLPQL